MAHHHTRNPLHQIKQLAFLSLTRQAGAAAALPSSAQVESIVSPVAVTSFKFRKAAQPARLDDDDDAAAAPGRKVHDTIRKSAPHEAQVVFLLLVDLSLKVY